MVVLNKSNRIANLMTVIGLAYWVHIITIRPDHQLGSLNHSPLLTTITIFFGILAVRIVQVRVLLCADRSIGGLIKHHRLS